MSGVYGLMMVNDGLIMVNNHWLVVWILFLFFHSVWNVIIPTDLFIFFRGVCIYSTNQMEI